VVLLVGASRGGPKAAIGDPAPDIVGTTLDGAPFRLADLRGHPVVVNFWGPSCVPCRDEFPLLAAKLTEHAADGLAVVGVLTDDPVAPAQDFVAEYHATWPTVVDPDKAAKNAYRVAGRPQTYFVDATGVIRSIQVGELQDADFERQYQRIAP
jgi:cytochrome c biogenesis protein CcmG, thiol:disulfide interchange protein DsbE